MKYLAWNKALQAGKIAPQVRAQVRPTDLSSIPRTHEAGEEEQCLPPTHAGAHIHTQNKEIQLKAKGFVQFSHPSFLGLYFTLKRGRTNRAREESSRPTHCLATGTWGWGEEELPLMSKPTVVAVFLGGEGKARPAYTSTRKDPCGDQGARAEVGHSAPVPSPQVFQPAIV